MTNIKISPQLVCLPSVLFRAVMVAGVAVLAIGSQSANLKAQTSNASIESDQRGDVVAETSTVVQQKDGNGISLDFLNEGKNPQSVSQLRAMQDHVRDIADRVKEATVNINMGMGQGSGVIVSSDGIILTAAHVIERPRQIALITFSDGSQAKARTLGVEAGKDSGMLKIFEVLDEADETDEADEADETDDADETIDADEDNSADDSGEEDNRQPGPSDDAGESSEEDANDSPDQESGKESGKEKSTEEDLPSATDGIEEDSDQQSGDSDEGLNNQSDKNSLPLEKSGERPEKIDVIAEALEKDDLPFFPYLDLAVSEELNDGQWVVAVGHPGGLDEKRGMVVRVGRIINQRDSAIRTDCTLVGGDSGGPLVDMDGNLIAIHSRIGSRLQDNLHVPVDVYSDTWDMLISGFKIGEKGRLGIDTSSGSTIVSKVSQRGPADDAGIEVGDIITAIDGKPVASRGDIGRVLSTRYPYETVTLKIRRGSNEVDVDVMLGEATSPRRRRRR